jgi:tetratricopeptide (TPR) repeat protein
MKASTKKTKGKPVVSKPVDLKKHFKDRLIRFIAIVLVPLSLILFIEIILRLFGYGTSSKFVFKTKVNGELCYVPNDDYTQKYFGRDMGRSTAAFAIPVIKKPNTIRIFLLGSSAAKGDPAPAYSMSEFLKVFLKEKYPAVNFEVINVGMTAINSHVVYQVASECSKLDPDMFIVYEGNNEVVGPFGPGTVFSPLLSNIHMIRLLASLKASRIGQFYTSIFSSANKPKEWGGMEMFLDKKVYSSNSDLQIVYRHFEHNLQDICKIASDRNIPIIISSVGVNLKDCAPFEGKSQHLTQAEAGNINDIFGLGQKLEKINKFQQALEIYSEGLKTDSLSGNIWFKIADCYNQLGGYTNAYACYRKSMDMDALRFRADSKINEIIKNTASNKENENIFFAQAEDMLIENSLNKIPGRDLFYDHVHLRFAGNYLVAKTLYEQAAKTIKLKNFKAGGELPGIEECGKRLGFTGWDQYKLCQDILSRYSRLPFTNQMDHEATVKLLQDEILTAEKYTSKDSLSGISAAYDYSLHYDPSNWLIYLRYIDFLQEGEMNYGKAEKLLLQVNKLINHPSVNSELGNVAIKEGKYDEAVTYYKKVVEQIPNSAAAYGNLALGYMMTGNYRQALVNYQKALRLNPDFKNVHYGIAGVYFRQGRYGDALTENKKEIMINSLSPLVYEQLGQIYEKTDSLEKSSQAFELAFRLDPYNITINKEWAGILIKTGRFEESAVHYKFIALKSDTSVQANIDCGNAFTRAGNFNEARYWYLKAVKMDPKNYACFNNLGNIYSALQKPDSAVYFYKRAVELKNNLPGLHVNLGTAYFNESKFDKAIESFDEALLIDSNFYAAHISKGSLYDFRAEPDLAATEFKKAIKLDPNNGIGYKKLGYILIRKNDYLNAIEITSKAFNLMPSDSDVTDMMSLAYFKYGNYLFSQHNYNEAIPVFNKAIQYDNNNSNPKIALAWTYYKKAQSEISQNNPAEGLTDLKNAVSVYPAFIEANYNLGIMLLQQNQADEAYKYIKQVYTINPKYFQVATIYNDLKKRFN